MLFYDKLMAFETSDCGMWKRLIRSLQCKYRVHQTHAVLGTELVQITESEDGDARKTCPQYVFGDYGGLILESKF